MNRFKSFLIVSTASAFILGSYPSLAATLPIVAPEKVGMTTSILTTVDEVINTAIADNRTPGAVLLVAHQGKIVYRKAYGNKMVKPQVEKMTVDTMFDMASLTKPSATGHGIMLLAQEGKLDVNAKVTTYIPEFGQNGKENVTVLNLLTHTSGLKPDGVYFNKGYSYDSVIQDICSMTTTYPTGTKFVYSDCGYIILGEIIRRVSGKPENEFVAEHFYKPLGMTDTGYLPPQSKWERCAPTEFRNGKWLQGQVHDPSAFEMGGVAGHAGLFSTADDMAILCQMDLNGGEYDGIKILNPETIHLMTTNQSPVVNQGRGLGWDVSSGYASQRGNIFPKEGFGHTGWTGTSVWVDTASKTIVILLCNRNHPDGKGNVGRLRSQVANIVASSLAKD